MKKTCPRCGGTGVVDNDRERGQFFRGLRIESGLAQREVARRTGFSVGYICDLEHGRRPGRGVLPGIRARPGARDAQHRQFASAHAGADSPRYYGLAAPSAIGVTVVVR